MESTKPKDKPDVQPNGKRSCQGSLKSRRKNNLKRPMLKAKHDRKANDSQPLEDPEKAVLVPIETSSHEVYQILKDMHRSLERSIEQMEKILTPRAELDAQLSVVIRRMTESLKSSINKELQRYLI